MVTIQTLIDFERTDMANKGELSIYLIGLQLLVLLKVWHSKENQGGL